MASVSDTIFDGDDFSSAKMLPISGFETYRDPYAEVREFSARVLSEGSGLGYPNKAVAAASPSVDIRLGADGLPVGMDVGFYVEG